MAARGRQGFLHVILGLLSLLGVQVLFYVVQVNQAQSTLKGVESILRKESVLVNPYLVGRAMADLENLGLLKCTLIQQSGGAKIVFHDDRFKSACGQSPLFLASYPIVARLPSGKGETWEVRFESLNAKWFHLNLWVARMFAVLLTSFGLLWHFGELKKKLQIQELKASHGQMMGKLATQVSHDIRSPLATLISIAHNSPGLDETVRVQLRNTASRIRDIANQLLDKNREDKPSFQVSENNPSGEAITSQTVSSEERSTQLLSAIIESVVSQKRLQYTDQTGVLIESNVHDGYGIFVTLQLTEFSRVISNLINNAVEALDQKGNVEISLRELQGRAVIEVRDNGKGIPPALLAKIGSQGETHGKVGGSGLGVYHAKKTIEAWGGTLEIQSDVGKGTMISLRLPLAHAPAWFVDRISLTGVSTVIVLDDDPGIHQIWETRLKDSPVKILHFYSSQEILKWFRKSLGGGESGDTPFYFCDYELIGSKETGLDMIEMFGIAAQSILVTSRFDEPAIQERCIRFGVRLLPKDLAYRVPITSSG